MTTADHPYRWHTKFAARRPGALLTIVPILLVVPLARPSSAENAVRERSIRIFDTVTPFGEQITLDSMRTWRTVPTEAGAQYHPEGDLVVQNQHLTAVLVSETAKLVLYSGADPKRPRVEVRPTAATGARAITASCRVVRHTGEQAAIACRFAGKDLPEDSQATFSFTKEQIVQVQPGGSARGVSLRADLSFAVVPSLISDDLIVDPRRYPSVPALHLPSENLLLGLAEGGDSTLIIAWPDGSQEVRLNLDARAEGKRLIGSVELALDEKPVFLAMVDAPGIWHAQELQPSYLEKDVRIEWRRPFPARWATQLLEDEVKTTFPFLDSRRDRQWRGGLGSYVYPVWFEGDAALYRLGKKIPPLGESVVYFLERTAETPTSLLSPVDVVARSLAPDTSERILDLDGRRLRPAYRLDSVVGPATCAVTGKLTPIFEDGNETAQRKRVSDGVQDMLAHLSILTERTTEYRAWAQEMGQFLRTTKADHPEAGPYVERMEGIVGELLAAYDASKVNIRDMRHAQDLARRTMALTAESKPDNAARFSKLGEDWRRMGGALEGLARRLNTLARKLFQEAGYSCLTDPGTVRIAEEIRRRTRQMLREPVEYEGFSDYDWPPEAGME